MIDTKTYHYHHGSYEQKTQKCA